MTKVEAAKKATQIHLAETYTKVSNATEMTYNEMKLMYGCSHATVWRTKKRGYSCVGYHTRIIMSAKHPALLNKEEKPKKEPVEKVVNMNVFEFYDELKPIALTTYNEYMLSIQRIDFQDYYDFFLDRCLYSKISNDGLFKETYLGYIKKIAISSAVLMLREASRRWNLAKINETDIVPTVTIHSAEIENPAEICEWAKEQIIKKFGVAAWNRVWAWCIQRRCVVAPKEIRKYFKI